MSKNAINQNQTKNRMIEVPPGKRPGAAVSSATINAVHQGKAEDKQSKTSAGMAMQSKAVGNPVSTDKIREGGSLSGAKPASGSLQMDREDNTMPTRGMTNHLIVILALVITLCLCLAMGENKKSEEEKEEIGKEEQEQSENPVPSPNNEPQKKTITLKQDDKNKENVIIEYDSKYIEIIKSIPAKSNFTATDKDDNNVVISHNSPKTEPPVVEIQEINYNNNNIILKLTANAKLKDKNKNDYPIDKGCYSVTVNVPENLGDPENPDNLLMTQIQSVLKGYRLEFDSDNDINNQHYKIEWKNGNVLRTQERYYLKCYINYVNENISQSNTKKYRTFSQISQLFYDNPNDYFYIIKRNPDIEFSVPKTVPETKRYTEEKGNVTRKDTIWGDEILKIPFHLVFTLGPPIPINN